MRHIAGGIVGAIIILRILKSLSDIFDAVWDWIWDMFDKLPDWIQCIIRLYIIGGIVGLVVFLTTGENIFKDKDEQPVNNAVYDENSPICKNIFDKTVNGVPCQPLLLEIATARGEKYDKNKSFIDNFYVEIVNSNGSINPSLLKSRYPEITSQKIDPEWKDYPNESTSEALSRVAYQWREAFNLGQQHPKKDVIKVLEMMGFELEPKVEEETEIDIHELGLRYAEISAIREEAMKGPDSDKFLKCDKELMDEHHRIEEYYKSKGFPREDRQYPEFYENGMKGCMGYNVFKDCEHCQLY